MDLHTSDYQWINPSRAVWGDRSLLLTAHPQSDWFLHPAGESCKTDGAFYHTQVAGDFVLRARVFHPFASLFDACALMLHSGEEFWAKLCYEYNTGGERCVVSVVNRDCSDGADGPVLEADSLWLQLARRGDMAVMHYSLDGVKNHRVRYFALPQTKSLLVGFLAQCPTGPGGEFRFDEISLELRSLQDLRSGK